MQDWLKAQAHANPQSLALLDQGQSWTFAQLDYRVDQLCARLTSLGLVENDFLSTLLPISDDHVILIHAAARLGLRLAALNTRLTAAELLPQFQITGCRWLVGQPPPGLTTSITSLTIDELWAQPEHPFTPPNFSLERLQGAVFTSGTTGLPKAATISFSNLFYSALGSANRLGILPADCWLSPLPLYHIGGQASIFRSAILGHALSLCQPDPAAPAAWLSAGVTQVSLVPTMLYRLLSAPTLYAPALRLVLLGGAAAPAELVAEASRRGLPCAPTYGLTETTSQAATLPPLEAANHPGSSGRALLNVRLRIVNEDDLPLAPGEIGEVCVQGPTVMQGYFNDPGSTQAALHGGWLHTGDLGFLDANGYLYLLQRRSDLVISGGENIYPVEVEQALSRHPAVAEVCVAGVPDSEWGQRLAALVVLRAEAANITAHDLQEYCRRNLANYKIPSLFKFVGALPLTGSGKVERRVVQFILAQAAVDDTQRPEENNTNQ